MTWLGLLDAGGASFDPCGLDTARAGTGPLLERGALMVETRLPAPQERRPQPLVALRSEGRPAFHLSLSALPGGALALVTGMDGDLRHAVLHAAESGRADIVRLTYCWDAPAGRARIGLERPDSGAAMMLRLSPPAPIALEALAGIFTDAGRAALSRDVLFVALSDRPEPLGPCPSLMPETPIATTRGYRPAGELERGDVVFTAEGELVPVLHALSRTVPARGSFAPVSLAAPYFGLLRDLTCAPFQRLVIGGSDVEYLFGSEAVLAPAGHLAAAFPRSGGVAAGAFVRYVQLLLPDHDPILAGGAVAESLFIGRMRRKPLMREASLLSGCDTASLPDHRRSLFPVLRPYEAAVLADRRAA